MEQFHMFSIGCLVGLILSYTGISTFISGLISGILLQASYPNIGNNIHYVIKSFSQFMTSFILFNTEPSKSSGKNISEKETGKDAAEVVQMKDE